MHEINNCFIVKDVAIHSVGVATQVADMRFQRLCRGHASWRVAQKPYSLALTSFHAYREISTPREHSLDRYSDDEVLSTRLPLAFA